MKLLIMAIIKLTKGESYLVAKENNVPVIVESSDSAGATFTINNNLVVSASNGEATIKTYSTDSSIFKLYANSTSKEVLKLSNMHNGSSADTYLEFHNEYLNDAWSMGIDASTDSNSATTSKRQTRTW